MSKNRVRDYSELDVIGDFTQFFELRMENDANGNPIYIGYNKTPGAGTAGASWFIVKITYDVNQSPTRQQLPSFGVSFTGVWDNRSTYFV